MAARGMLARVSEDAEATRPAKWSRSLVHTPEYLALAALIVTISAASARYSGVWTSERDHFAGRVASASSLTLASIPLAAMLCPLLSFYQHGDALLEAAENMRGVALEVALALRG